MSAGRSPLTRVVFIRMLSITHWRNVAKRDGSKATVWDVAAAAGVSAQTVSRALNNRGYVSEHTRERVMAAAQQLEYAPNIIGKSLRSTRSPMVGLVVADITNPFYARLHRALEGPLTAAGLSVLLLNCDDDSATERRQLALLSAYRPTGLVLVPAHGSGFSAADVAEFENVVLVSRTLAGVDVPTVVFDENAAFASATESLCASGHRRIAAILGPEGVSTTSHREEGFRAVAEQFGAEALIRYCDGTSAGGYSAAKELLISESAPTGVVGFNVPVTEGILSAAHDLDLSIPTDLSVVSFTDAAWMATTRPAITAVAQPIEEMGRIAGELIVERSRGGAPSPGPHLGGIGELRCRESVSKPQGGH